MITCATCGETYDPIAIVHQCAILNVAEIRAALDAGALTLPRGALAVLDAIRKAGGSQADEDRFLANLSIVRGRIGPIRGASRAARFSLIGSVPNVGLSQSR